MSDIEGAICDECGSRIGPSGCCQTRRNERAKELGCLDQIKFLERTGIAFTKLVDHVNWMAQTVHQAYHTEQPGHWMACPKDICRSTAFKLSEIVELGFADKKSA